MSGRHPSDCLTDIGPSWGHIEYRHKTSLWKAITLHFWVLILISLFGVAPSAYAAAGIDCGPLKPNSGTDRQVEDNVKANANILFKSLGSGQIENGFKIVENDVLNKYPNADRLLLWRSYLYITCSLLANSAQWTDDQKFEKLLLLIDKLNAGPPPADNPPGKHSSYQLSPGEPPLGFNGRRSIVDDITQRHQAKCVSEITAMDLDAGLDSSQRQKKNFADALVVFSSNQNGCDDPVALRDAAIYRLQDSSWHYVKRLATAQTYLVSGPLVGLQSNNTYSVIWVRPENEVTLITEDIEEGGWGFVWINGYTFIRNGSRLRVQGKDGSRSTDSPMEQSLLRRSDIDLLRLNFVPLEIKYTEQSMSINGKAFPYKPYQWANFQGDPRISSVGSLTVPAHARILPVGGGCRIEGANLAPEFLGSWQVPTREDFLQQYGDGPFDMVPTMVCLAPGKVGLEDAPYEIWLRPPGVAIALPKKSETSSASQPVRSH
jgi:hypothetical protein